MKYFQTTRSKFFAVAVVLFAFQHLPTGSDEAQSPEAKQESYHKASLSCQNWKKDGYGELMGC